MPLQGSFKESAGDTFVTDQGEIGPGRRRNRFTRALRRFSFSATLSEAERVAFLDFYVTTLANGVKSFAWTHTLTAEVVTVVVTSRPQFEDVTPGYWRTSIRLEEI